MVRSSACLDSHALTSKMWAHVINWEIHDSFSIQNTWKDSQSSFTCPMWLMHLLPVYNMYDHIAHTHNIGSPIMCWGCLNRMIMKPAISISHPAETICFHFEWLGFESECSDSWLWLHLQALTLQWDLTQIFSAVSCLTARNIWEKKIRLYLSPFKVSCIFRELHWSSLQMLPVLALSCKVTSGGRANNDCPLWVTKTDVALHCFTNAKPLLKFLTFTLKAPTDIQTVNSIFFLK